MFLKIVYKVDNYISPQRHHLSAVVMQTKLCG